MKVQFGNGNAYAISLNTSAKTLAITNLLNADITPSNISVYNTTRTAWMIGGDSTAVGTVAITYASGQPVFTVTLDKLPASTADGDTLVAYAEIPNPAAEYGALVFIGESI